MRGTPTDVVTTEVDVNQLSVNELIKQKLHKTKDNTWEGMDKLEISDDKKEAIHSELRRRDTEGSYTRTRQELLAANAKLQVYEELFQPDSALPVEEQERLETLKFADPDAWLVEITKAKEAAASAIESKATAALKVMSDEEVVVARGKELEAFNASTTTPLTDEQLQFDIPQRLIQQVEAGEITFGDLLVKAHGFINGTKTISNPQHTEEPSFDGVAGGQTPEYAKDKANVAYENIIF